MDLVKYKGLIAIINEIEIRFNKLEIFEIRLIRFTTAYQSFAIFLVYYGKHRYALHILMNDTRLTFNVCIHLILDVKHAKRMDNC